MQLSHPQRGLVAARLLAGIEANFALWESLPGFDLDAAFRSYLAQAFAAADRLAFDVRGNSGGDTPEALVAALMTRPYRSWRATTPVHVALSRAQGGPRETREMPAAWHDPSPGASAGPLANLTDGGTFSAAEDFVMPFKDNGRALLVGETTGGSSGQPASFEIGDGMRCWIGAKRQYFPDGRPFEGLGIEPDVMVPAEPADFRDGRDRASDAAVRHLTLGCIFPNVQAIVNLHQAYHI